MSIITGLHPIVYMFFDFRLVFIILDGLENQFFHIFNLLHMRIPLVVILSLLTLSACSMNQKAPAQNVSAEANIPAGITVQSGALYPSMPLEDFQKMQSGVTESGTAATPTTTAL